METIVFVKDERLFGDNQLLYIVNGKVKAGLDLSNLITMTGYDVEVIAAATYGSCNLS